MTIDRRVNFEIVGSIKRGRRCSNAWSRVRALACAAQRRRSGVGGGLRSVSRQRECDGRPLDRRLERADGFGCGGPACDRHPGHQRDQLSHHGRTPAWSGRGRQRRGPRRVSQLMVAVNADNGACLGLVAGSVYTRKGRFEVPHAKRKLSTRNPAAGSIRPPRPDGVGASRPRHRRLATGRATSTPSGRPCPTRELPLLTRVMHDRAVAGGGLLSSAAAILPVIGERT